MSNWLHLSSMKWCSTSDWCGN